ncbi:MAG: hypothetical protein K2P99_07000 [Burkholderiales bacterium]|nr:hypothetical protein [Burkholderiales bacterium]
MDNNYSKEELRSYVNEMYQQLGGKYFSFMVHPKVITYGTSQQLYGDGSCIVALVIFLPQSIFNKHKVHRFDMCLMGNDTYTFKFYKKDTKVPFNIVKDVYCDMVQDTFELNTGLLVTLHNRNNSQVVVGVNA